MRTRSRDAKKSRVYRLGLCSPRSPHMPAFVSFSRASPGASVAEGERAAVHCSTLGALPDAFAQQLRRGSACVLARLLRVCVRSRSSFGKTRVRKSCSILLLYSLGCAAPSHAHPLPTASPCAASCGPGRYRCAASHGHARAAEGTTSWITVSALNKPFLPPNYPHVCT